MTTVEAVPRGLRERILEATVDLLGRGGRDAVTTRAVSEAAGVQPPAIYRVFGDKQGLLEAAAVHGFSRYLSAKTRRPIGSDAVEDLRGGWDEHVRFGLENPALYLLMYGDPQPGRRAPAAEQAFALLRSLIRRIAEAGRLRVPEERAVAAVHAAGRGATLSLIAEDASDPGLSALLRDAVIGAITTDAESAGSGRVAAAANLLRADLPLRHDLSVGESALLGELLVRIAGRP